MHEALARIGMCARCWRRTAASAGTPVTSPRPSSAGGILPGVSHAPKKRRAWSSRLPRERCGARRSNAPDQETSPCRITAVPLPCSHGRNVLTVTTTNTAETIESAPIETVVHVHADARPPTLYGLAVGVTNYRDRALHLRYAARDATVPGRDPAAPGARAVHVVIVTPLLDANATLSASMPPSRHSPARCRTTTRLCSTSLAMAPCWTVNTISCPEIGLHQPADPARGERTAGPVDAMAGHDQSAKEPGDTRYLPRRDIGDSRRGWGRPACWGHAIWRKRAPSTV